MQDLVERTRQSVFKRHNVMISEDDPIFMSLTIHNEMIASYHEEFQARLEAHEKRLENLYIEERNKAIDISTTLINRTIETLIKETSDNIQQSIRGTVSALLKQIEEKMETLIAGVKQASDIGTLKAYTLVAVFFFIAGFFLRGTLFR